MLKSLLALAVGLLAVAPAAPAQSDGQRGRVRQTPKEAPKEAPRQAPKEAPDDDAARRTAEAVATLRAAFAEEYFRRKLEVSEQLEAAREQAGGDEAAFAAARTELAREHRGALAALRAAYAEKARGLGVDLALPGDEAGLERAAAATSPAAALRAEFATEVAALARAAQGELRAARAKSGADEAAFAAARTEIARRYRGQVVALQQSFAQRAAGAGATVDTSDVSKVMAALAADAAPPRPVADPAPAGTPPTPPAPPAPRPIDAEVLRNAFTQQVETLRTALAAELATADATLKGDDLATKRAAIVQKHRATLAAYRANVVARAQAAGVTLTLPTDQELAPELGSDPVAPPKGPADGATPPQPAPKPEAPKPERPKPDGEAPGNGPAPAPPAPATGGKRGRGPRFGNGGG